MKHILFLCLLLVCSLVSIAQYEAAVRYLATSPTFSVAADTLIQRAMAANPADTTEGGAVNQLARWKNFIGGRISNNVAVGADMNAPLSQALGAYMASAGPCGAGGNWSCLGPFISSYNTTANGHNQPTESQGRINAIWVDPADSNTILAGSDAGGLWKTTDEGRHWSNITDGSPVPGTMGISAIAVDPLNTSIIYLALSSVSNQYTKSAGYSLGLAYSTNGGATWVRDAAFNTLIGGGLVPGNPVIDIAYMPGTQKLFASYNGNNVLYNAGGPGSPWTDITPTAWLGGCSGIINDLKFSKQAPIKVVVCVGACNDTSQLWTFDSTGTALADMKMYLPAVYTQTAGAVNFSISSGDTAYIYFVADSGTTHYMLMRTSINTFNLAMVNPVFLGSFGSKPTRGPFQQFEVSPGNSEIMYAGCASGLANDAIYKSFDGGQSFPRKNFSDPFATPPYSSNYLDTFFCSHADGRCVYIYNGTASDSGINDVVFMGTDGGIRKKRSGSQTFVSITGEGLGVSEFYGLGNTEANENIMVGGAQDGGGFTYIKARSDPWENDEGGDGFGSKVMRNGINISMVESDRPNINSITFADTTVTLAGVKTPPSEGSILIRPLYFDPNNEAYLGNQHIWKRPYGSTGWVKAFPSGDPIDVGAATNNAAVDFYIDEQDSNNVYIAYYDAANTDPTPSAGFSAGKLFHSYNATSISPPPTWTNITPPQVQYDRINSIAVDPKHHNRIWVALGNVNSGDVSLSPGSMMRRVYYSDDTGTNWSDVSTNLTALPVNKLLYRKGSDDDLYAGTDAGVFHWNKAANYWDCFNNGMPTCIVMDMEMNYCAGKLRVATYGRGIWETPVIDIIPAVSQTVTGINVWTGGQHLYKTGSIDIPSGSALEIKDDTLHMEKGALIIVEPGGHLIVNHGMITNSCEKCFWGGIQARGVATISQDPSNLQGFVTIENGATIANATIGVANSNSAKTWSTNGGIIQAEGSFFVNCQTSIDFQGYDNWHTSPGCGGTCYTLFPNRSYFYNCSFLVDNNYKGNSLGWPMQSMVSMHSVEGINFEGCIFRNTDKAAINKGLGSGICAVNSAFNIIPYCPWTPFLTLGCSSPVLPQFSGFANAVDIRGLWQPGLAVNIDQASFDTSTIGVYVNNFNDVSVTRCNFNVGRGRPVDSVLSEHFSGCAQNVGILEQNSSVFRVEENNFKKVTNFDIDYYGSPWYNFGTVVANSGGKMNKIYRNSFDSGFDYAVYAIGDNWYSDSMLVSGKYFEVGLQVLCNSFSNNGYDIAASNDGGSMRQGINDQGSYAASTGNTFSGSSSNVANYASNAFYYYYAGPSSYPSIYSFPMVMPVAAGVSANSCPSSFGTGLYSGTSVASTALDMSSLRTHQQTFRDDQTSFRALMNIYKSQIDFGNTDSLVHVIDTSAYSPALYSMLGSGSPYISTKALKAASDITVLSYSQMMNVMIQNPDDLRDHDFLNYVNNDYGFSAADMDTLISASFHNTDRTTLEQNIKSKQTTLDDETNIILMALTSPSDTNVSVFDTTGAGLCTDSSSVYYRMDSTAYYVGLDSLDTWLQNIGGLWTNYERAAYYNFRRQPDIADSIFRNIKHILPAEPITDSTTDRGAYTTDSLLWSIIKGAEADGRSAYTLTDDEMASLSPHASPGITYNSAALMIGGITKPYITPVYPCVLVHVVYARYSNGGGTTPMPPPIIDINGNSGNNQFSVYPNPTSGVVTFSYNIQDGGTGMHIVITNVLGEKVADLQPSGNAGNALWDPGHVASGVYIYTASDNKGVVSKGKVVLLH